MPEIDANIRKLLNSRPHFSAEGFVATRILRGFEIVGAQAVAAAWDTLNMTGKPAPWPLAERMVTDILNKDFRKSHVSAFGGRHEEIIDHIASMYDPIDFDEEGYPFIFARLHNDSTAVYYVIPHALLTHPLMYPTFTAIGHPDSEYVIIKQPIKDFIDNLQSIET